MAIIRTILHEFSMGDVDDPELYAAFPLSEWERSEAGQWAMKNCVDTPSWALSADPFNWGHRITVYGDLYEHDHTYFKLKFYDYTKR
jgi:hypothetical protein